MKVLTIQSINGGSGKSTLACLLAKYAAKQGKKVCLVDCDFICQGLRGYLILEHEPESSLTQMAFAERNPHPELLGVYMDKDPGSQFQVIFSHSLDWEQNRHMQSIVGREPQMPFMWGRVQVVLDWLHGQNYDLVILDASPNFSHLNHGLREMATNILVLMTPDRQVIHGTFKYLLPREDSYGDALVWVEGKSHLALNCWNPDRPSTLPVLLDALNWPDKNRASILALEPDYSLIPRCQQTARIFGLEASGYLPTITEDYPVTPFLSSYYRSLLS